MFIDVVMSTHVVVPLNMPLSIIWLMRNVFFHKEIMSFLMACNGTLLCLDLNNVCDAHVLFLFSSCI